MMYFTDAHHVAAIIPLCVSNWSCQCNRHTPHAAKSVIFLLSTYSAWLQPAACGPHLTPWVYSVCIWTHWLFTGSWILWIWEIHFLGLRKKFFF